MNTATTKALRPVQMRKELHDIVVELRSQGLTYSQIIDRVLVEKGVRLRKSHVSGWVTGRHHPYGSTHEFDLVPTPELAYVTGVAKGDASQSIQTWNYRIRLRVSDKEFAEEFDRCACAVLRCRRHSVRWIPNKGLWSVQVGSVLLYRFLEQSLSHLRHFVSHCERCAASFLREVFDSEASMSSRSLTVSNTNMSLLRLSKRLLKGLGIATTGPRIMRRGGREVMIKGKMYHANKNIYLLYVRTSSLVTYARRIGFAIISKQMAVALALKSGSST